VPKISKPNRILAIYPGVKEMGFAVFDEETLIRFGVKNLRNGKNPEKILERGKKVITDLKKKFNPGVLVLGIPDHPKRTKNPLLKKLVRAIQETAKKERMKVYEYEPSAARELIYKEGKPTRGNVARFIASLYPELEAYVPRTRRILWSKKDFYWLNAFEACTLALAYVEKSRVRKALMNI
jgi:RNase H-fold protein (predicted Holliday junction resolvase)